MAESLSSNTSSRSTESFETSADPFGPLIASRGMKVVHMNAQGLSPCKVDQLMLLTKDTRIDFLCITETHLKDEMSEAMCNLPNYHQYAQRRENEQGWGGVLIFANDRYHSSLHVSGSSLGLDYIVVKVEMVRTSPILIACFYRNPSMTVPDTSMAISSVLEQLSGEVLIVGDFNFTPGSTMDNEITRDCFTQLITEPTRVTNVSSTTIDLIYSNAVQKIQLSGVLDFCLADHLSTFVVRKIHPKTAKRADHIYAEYRCWKNFSNVEFQRLLSKADVNILASLKSVDVATEAWTLHVNNCLNELAPTKRKRVRDTFKSPWLNKDIFELMRIRDHWQRRFLIKRSYEDPQSFIFWKLFKKVRNLVVKVVRLAKRNYYDDLFRKTNFTGKNFWKDIKPFLPSSRKREMYIPDLDAVNDAFVTEPTLIRQTIINSRLFELNGAILWDHFVFPLEQFTLPEPSFDVTSEIIRRMDINKATGCDLVGPRVLKGGGGYISEMITEIVRQSFSSAIFPKMWKSCRVTAILKSDGTNRPITVIPSPSKIEEEYVVEALLRHHDKIKFWKPNQFGFRKNHSTASALLCIQNTVTTAMEAGNFVVLLAIDFKKAFDLVDHQLLLDILLRINCDDKALSWFKSYLSQRQQRVQQGNRSSAFRTNNLGVPQGSKMGPLLYVIYIMTLLGLELYGKLFCYADDASLVYTGSSLSVIEWKINEDLRRISEWTAMYSAVLNTLKTNYLIIRGRKEVRDLNITYEGCPIERKSKFKLLGVVFEESFQFAEHINEMHSKALKRINLLSRLRHFLPTEALSTIYKCAINPIFLYCSAVWRWSPETYISKIVRLQKKAARVILFKSNRESSEPLFSLLGWNRISSEWDVQVAKLIFKAVNGIGSTLFNCCFRLKLQTSTRRSQDSTLLDLPLVRKETFLKRTIFYNGVKLYNGLMKSTRESDSLSSFTSDVRFHFR